MLDLRQLRYFVTVAETEHVGRAAELLHISQSPLSRQIAQLEERLGLRLFERSQQRIRLTDDGRVFMNEARALLTHAERLESLGRRLGRGEEGGLCIGYVAHAMHADVLPGALRALQCERPDTHVALYNQPSAEQLEGLRQRSLDIALVSIPPMGGDPDLVSTLVLEDPLLLALPARHPLARRDRIEPADLNGEGWIAVDAKQDLSASNAFLATCVQAGFTPDIRLETAEPLTALSLVASGLGMAMIQKSMARGATEDVVLRQLPWFTSSVRLWAAWHKIDLRPLVEAFRQTLFDSLPGLPAGVGEPPKQVCRAAAPSRG